MRAWRGEVAEVDSKTQFVFELRSVSGRTYPMESVAKTIVALIFRNFDTGISVEITRSSRTCKEFDSLCAGESDTDHREGEVPGIVCQRDLSS
jgi:hypothetical protein